MDRILSARLQNKCGRSVQSGASPEDISARYSNDVTELAVRYLSIR